MFIIKLGGDLVAQDVLCAVSSCFFWKDGNKCSAEAIFVDNQFSNEATNSAQTDCKTFTPKS